MSGFKDEKFIKKQTYVKTETCIYSILESLEYFCQISAKLILIIFSYTVSKLVHLLGHSVVSLRCSLSADPNIRVLQLQRFSVCL